LTYLSHASDRAQKHAQEYTKQANVPRNQMSEFVTVLLPVCQKTFFWTVPEGRLKIGSEDGAEGGGEDGHAHDAVVVSFALGLEPWGTSADANGYEEWDLCHCRLQIADANGDLWEAKSLFTADVLVQHIQDWQRGSEPFAYAHATAQYQRAFETRTLLSGIRAFYDDRLYRRLSLGDETYEILFKYQYPRFDIAFLEDSNRPHDLTATPSGFDFSKLLVRVSGFQTRDGQAVPPFVYDLDCRALMFYPNTQSLPAPLMFQKMGADAAPQRQVRWLKARW
jgi:hypothetical protein